MENLKNPTVMGKKIFKLLEENKILLLQDKNFPSIVTGIVGKPIAGSWWAHPLANPIYNGLLWLDHNKPILVVKLIDGKVTYLHESLFLDFFSIVCSPRDWQLEKLKRNELKLFKFIAKKKTTTSDDPGLTKLTEDPKKVLTVLEKKLLVHSVEEHTKSGKHIKKIMTWDSSKIFTSKPKNYLDSKKRIEDIIEEMGRMHKSKIKLPW